MSAPMQATMAEADATARWRASVALLLAGLVAFGLLFNAEAAAAVRVWNASTAYNHCWLVLPIVAWLTWTRRHRLAALTPEPSALGALLALPAAIAWLAAERLGVMEGRQFAVIGLLWALALGVLGLRVCRAFAAPLLYLVFLVPFGGFAVPLLQAITARMIEWGLLLLGIPHHMDGLLIETRAGFFHVAEACAGLRFIVAALAFGALYAFTMYRSPGRRIAVMALALIVPIVANGLRALGIVVLAEHLGSAEAAAADHIIYGWGFFSVIILLLIAAGLPFRQDGTPEPVAAPAREGAPRTAAVAAALLAVLGIAAAGPAGAAALDHAAGLPDRSAVVLAAPAECATDGTVLRCEGAAVSAELIVFPTRVTWAAVATERRRAQSGSDEDQTYVVALPGRAAWQVRQHADGSGVTATAAWLGGQPAGDGLKSRARQGVNSLGGSGGRPVLVTVAIAQPYPRARVTALLEAQADGLVARAAALSVR